MERYYITNKELKKAIREIGYEYYGDIWKLFEIIIAQKGYTLERIKNEILASGIRTRKDFTIALNSKLQELIDGFLTLYGLKRYIGDWHINEMFKGNLRDPNIQRKIFLYNRLLTTLEKYKEEEMLLDFTKDLEFDYEL